SGNRRLRRPAGAACRRRPAYRGRERGPCTCVLRAVVAANVLVMRGVRGWRGRRRRGLGGGFLLFFLVLLLFDADFFLERAPQLVGGLLEFGQALAERAPQLGQLPRTKDDERDHENDDQLGHSDRTKHSLLLSQNRARRNGYYSPEVVVP